MRPYDYALGVGVAALGPAGFMLMEKMAPSQASPNAIRGSMRLMGVIGVTAGFLRAYTESSRIPPIPPPLSFFTTNTGPGNSPLLGLDRECARG